MKRRYNSHKNTKPLSIFFSLALLILAVAVFINVLQSTADAGNGSSGNSPHSSENAESVIQEYAEKHGIDYSEYPESIIELYKRNEETKDFVLKYPEEHNKTHKVNMKEYKNANKVPLFMQWDTRWGYKQYGNDVAGITGCGPVCLSMAAYYLTGDSDMSPDKIIDFAIDNGYCIKGEGSAWSLISEGGEKLGFDVTEIPLDENRIVKNLEAGNPIICVMGPGDFTSTGHFIVLTGYKNGEISVNDSNSHKNSEKTWKYKDIKNQIKNLWVIRNK